MAVHMEISLCWGEKKILGSLKSQRLKKVRNILFSEKLSNKLDQQKQVKDRNIYFKCGTHFVLFTLCNYYLNYMNHIHLPNLIACKQKQRMSIILQ